MPRRADAPIFQRPAALALAARRGRWTLELELGARDLCNVGARATAGRTRALACIMFLKCDAQSLGVSRLVLYISPMSWGNSPTLVFHASRHEGATRVRSTDEGARVGAHRDPVEVHGSLY